MDTIWRLGEFFIVKKKRTFSDCNSKLIAFLPSVRKTFFHKTQGMELMLIGQYKNHGFCCKVCFEAIAQKIYRPIIELLMARR